MLPSLKKRGQDAATRWNQTAAAFYFVERSPGVWFHGGKNKKWWSIELSFFLFEMKSVVHLGITSNIGWRDMTCVYDMQRILEVDKDEGPLCRCRFMVWCGWFGEFLLFGVFTHHKSQKQFALVDFESVFSIAEKVAGWDSQWVRSVRQRLHQTDRGISGGSLWSVKAVEDPCWDRRRPKDMVALRQTHDSRQLASARKSNWKFLHARCKWRKMEEKRIPKTSLARYWWVSFEQIQLCKGD